MISDILKSILRRVGVPSTGLEDWTEEEVKSFTLLFHRRGGLLPGPRVIENWTLADVRHFLSTGECPGCAPHHNPITYDEWVTVEAARWTEGDEDKAFRLGFEEGYEGSDFGMSWPNALTLSDAYDRGRTLGLYYGGWED